MKTKPNTRRNFLLAAGLGSAGAVAVVATRNASTPADEKQASATDKAQGYRVTAHIEKYYKTTEV